MKKIQLIHHRPRSRRDPIMEHIYDQFNGKYFNGSLPKIKVGYSRHIHHNYGMTLVSSLGKPLIILINREHRSWINLSCATLLHEMIHVKLTSKFGLKGLGHGRRFKREKRRLLRIGAFTEYL